ncbi:MAG: bifunctional oligoribonuclease/PAP phosphatase NrnA [Bacteroidales bacterium]|nr:bifunctional oligoribonuclease/PAP phosphatase NrnA [Bacteroidales bacterium]
MSENIVIIHHYNPDGDAIGSSLGLYNAIKQTGKKVSVISPSQFPDNLRWLPGAKDMKVVGKKTQSDITILDGADMIICVDMNARKRVGVIQPQFDKSTAFKALLDHHPFVETFTNVAIADTSYSSACELVYEFIENTFLNQYFNTDVVTCLYTGILTDTGSFEYNSSNPNLFRVVGKIMEYGIEKNKIYNRLFNAWSEDRIRFMGFVTCSRMVVMPEYKTAYIYITAEDRRKYKEKFGDTENFVNIPMQIKGIVFTAIFIERDNFIKASFRSKGTFDVNSFSAKHFNGGGHVNASGGESYDKLDSTCKKFEELVCGEYAEELKNYIY